MSPPPSEDRHSKKRAVSREPLERLRMDPEVSGLGRRLLLLGCGVFAAIALVFLNHGMRSPPKRNLALPVPASAASRLDFPQAEELSAGPDLMEAVKRAQTGGQEGLGQRSSLPDD